LKNLQNKANRLRMTVLKMIYAAQSGHPGPSFSAMDLLVSLFFGGFLEFDPKNPKWPERDYFILSKGHSAPALYAILAELGYFESEHLYELRQAGSLLQGHPRNDTPGIEVCTGSLGQGLSIASGIAMGLKLDGKPNKVFSLHGDGEMQEGQIWEAAMNAHQQKLGNLVAIVDQNGLQIDGLVKEICSICDLGAKFSSFGWKVFECSGHDYQEIFSALKKAIAVKDKPAVIVAHTVKGKGVSFMENQVGWHGKAPSDEQFAQGFKELEKASG
jgi:transketolase